MSLVYGSILLWSGKPRFYDNMTGVDGDAMVVYDHSDVFGSGDTKYARNRALDNAGGILVLGNCPVSWSGEAVFACNTAETYLEVRSLYMTALKPFGVGKHNSMTTGPAVLGWRCHCCSPPLQRLQ